MLGRGVAPRHWHVRRQKPPQLMQMHVRAPKAPASYSTSLDR
jgi:hypothetical protein